MTPTPENTNRAWMPSAIMIAAMTLGLSNANAQKLSIGVFKSDAPEATLLVTSDLPCSPTTPNAMILRGTKRSTGCWSLDADKTRFSPSEAGEAARSFDTAQLAPFGQGSIATFAQVQMGKPNKTHLTCEADGWTMEVDVERTEAGALQRFLVAGDPVMANEKSTQITFSYDGLAFSLNTVNASFSYETAGIQNYIRKNLFGSGKSKGNGACRINELQKKF